MINIDMWYKHDTQDADRIDVTFYPHGFYTDDSEYRGNIFRGSEIIGDYVATGSMDIKRAFPQLSFSW